MKEESVPMVSSQSHDDRSHTLDHPTQTSVAVAATATSPSSSSPSSSASSSSWSVASLQEQWNTFQDSQRLERLASCLELDQLLKECRKQQISSNGKNNNNNNTNLVQTTDPLESISPGLRTMKYFGWRGILSQLRPQQSMVAKEDINPTATGSIIQEQDDDSHDRDHHRELDAIHRQIQSSCSREQHAVWACRAVATGCGKELASLKRCFEEQHHAYDVLTVPRTNYEGSSNTEGKSDRRTIPCFEEQQVMGSCVTTNALQLLERKQQREGRKKESSSS
ncbi:hypothetical protein IV203_021727 [Nitzschia inconspicua]|uniref:Uncharacterized protein n=1 Tax=Nitzschia inconspicua TaxID=303405 RepID=A0A9K3KII5_9STRA|nr:hypothetical protein IV203_021727 [Nitzschia inconspicua]